MCIKRAQIDLNLHDVIMAVFLSSGLKDSDGSTGWFPCSRCLRNMACYFLTCPLYYYLNDYIRFWQLSADVDRHLGLGLLLPKATMEFIPRLICPAVLLTQAFCSSKKWHEVSDGRERQRERDDGQSETETELKREKGKNSHTNYFCFSLASSITTRTTESIIWLLQRYLILTTPVKKFHEIWIHYTMNCTAEADSS